MKNIALNLSNALDTILDKWVYRKGLVKIGGPALNVNFAVQVKRIKRGPAPYGFTRMSNGLLAPMREYALSHNIVVNEGLDDILDVYLSSGTQKTSWYLGLSSGTPSFAAGDTLSSHAGWVEYTDYDEANRQLWIDAGVASQSVDNSGSPATFTSSSDGNVAGGSFLASDNTKGGTTGTLYAGASFGSNKTLDTAETIDVTATFTAADDGV